MELPIDFVGSSAGELHQRNEKSDIVCDCKKDSIIILQVFGVYLEDKLIAIRPKMTELHGCSSEQIVLPFMLGVLRGETVHYGAALLIPHEICVEDSCLLSLVSPVEYLQYISTDELIVGIEGYDY
jgi:hypothetical protein